MISLAPAEVQGVVRTTHAPTRQIPFRFRALPFETTPDRSLSQSAKLLHAVLIDAGRRKGACTYTNRSLGSLIGRSPATVKRLLAELEAAGLARRELSAGGRIRSGVVPFVPGVAHSCPTGQMGVAHSQSGGGSIPAPGVAHSCAASMKSAPQNENQTGPIFPSLRGEEDPEAAALFAELGPAAYLRAMIAKGREAAGKPAPAPAPAGPARASQDEPTPPVLPYSAPVADRPATAKPAASTTTPRREEARQTPLTNVAVSDMRQRTPAAPRTTVAGPTVVIANPAAARAYPPAPCVSPDQVAAAVAKMTRGLADQLRAEDVGRRRVGPRKLAAQLAEVRRRHGRRG